ncbi:PREDICTED: uncharacterized protein LOC109230002 [Nicotiana attenuata]|uniref:uncharacterized protein LOC109230002 n=1 Tax=Nicotiana attenuata TaxID=49451 RepID=UPI0009048FCE|nr:PREDICTED: uncharacterized protein LOC109230002 [Nicotiana attenuata]
MGDFFVSGTNSNNNDPVNPSVLQNNTSPTVIDVVATKTQIININPTSQLPIKLVGGANFATWKAQIQKVMNDFDLMGYLDGSITPPPHTIKQGTQDVVNPDFKIWFQKDNLIGDALMASVDSTIAPSVASAETSKEAWDYLHTTHTNRSQTRIYSLRDALAKVQRDQKSITGYLREIRTITDELDVLGALISNEESIMKILSGLAPEYEALSTVIRSRDSPISYEELAHKLTDHELYLKQAE